MSKGWMQEDNFGFKNCWLAYFDILGFRGLVEVATKPEDLVLTRMRYSAALKALQKLVKNSQLLDFTYFSDTFIIFSNDDSKGSYGAIQQAAKEFMHKCISNRVPMRGAISFGRLTDSFNRKEKVLIGPALIDAYDHGEDQKWIGLILTPKALNKINKFKLNPITHDFRLIDKGVMKKFNTKPFYAYRLSCGRHSAESPLLPPLNEMKQKVKSLHRGTTSKKKKDKYLEIIAMYERTENFLKKHYEFT